MLTLVIKLDIGTAI